MSFLRTFIANIDVLNSCLFLLRIKFFDIFKYFASEQKRLLIEYSEIYNLVEYETAN